MIDAPVVSVHIPLAFRCDAGGHEEVTASGDTVGEVLESVVHEFPAIRARLFAEDGGLQPGVAVFLGPRSIREMQGLLTPVELEEVLTLVSVGI